MKKVSRFEGESYQDARRRTCTPLVIDRGRMGDARQPLVVALRRTVGNGLIFARDRVSLFALVLAVVAEGGGCMDILSELSWQPTIGDPTFMGWFTVAAYGFAAALAAMAGSRHAAGNRRIGQRERWIWLGVAGLMAILCINKQLDLQSLATDIGRVMARRQGWYEERRYVQELFVVVVLAGAAGFGCWSIWRFRELWKAHKLLAGGMLFLLTFIVVRAISFHHFDAVIGTRVLGVRMNWVFELTGIFLVSLAAARVLWGATAPAARARRSLS